MSRICIYGTVYNNVNTVEESIKSVFNPSYDIVIVDNYSEDGTWQKLLELRKEYNLTLLRLRSSRGKGRAYALEHCQDNSLTAYFDLDMYYNEVFHKILWWSTSKQDKIVHIPYSVIAKKEIIQSKGSWKDLNIDEDTELVARIGFDYHVPVVAVTNLYRVNINRERRYGKNLKYYRRKFRNILDSIRGSGYNFHDIIEIYSQYGKTVILGISMIYLLAKLKGIYRYNEKINNKLLYIYNTLTKLFNPTDIGISDKFFLYFLLITYSNMKDYVAQKLQEKIGDLMLYKCNDGFFRFVKNEEGLKLALQQSNFLGVECEKVPLEK